MKVKIEKLNSKDKARVIFEIENEADAIDFHDKVAIKIVENCKFIGDCYDLAWGLRFNAEHDLSFPTTPPSGPLI